MNSGRGNWAIPADSRQQTAGENGDGAVVFKPVLGGNHFLCPHASFGGVPENQVAAAFVAQVVGNDRSRNTGGGADDYGRPEGKNILGHQESGKA